MARSEPSRSRSRLSRLAAGVAIALALPFGVACNSLIGLSDFEKGQCAGARCPDEGGFIDQIVEGGTDAPVDAGPDGKGADPVSWAKWRMPNYINPDAGPGQPVGNGSLTAGAGFVVDNITTLTWRSTLVAGTFAATDVDAECRKITAGGPWRAPKRIELVTLLDFSQSSPPFVDTTKFTDLSLDTVWSTSEVRPFVAGPDQAYWVVNFGTGAVLPLKATTKARVLCVQASK